MAEPRRSRKTPPDSFSVWVREEIGTVEMNMTGEEPPAVVAFRLIDEQVGRGRGGTYGFNVYGTEYTVTAEPA